MIIQVIGDIGTLIGSGYHIIRYNRRMVVRSTCDYETIGKGRGITVDQYHNRLVVGG